jgi:hypothetical protein
MISPRLPARPAGFHGGGSWAFLLAALALAGCLSGPALGGGAIGIAPDPRDAALLEFPDSTRGQSFIISSNRRDLMDETRTELNVSARAFERLLGERPLPAEVRFTSTDSLTTVHLKVGSRALPAFSVPVSRQGRGRPGLRGSDALRVASWTVSVMAREWLSEFLRTQFAETPGGAPRPWMEESRLAPWLRVGMLQSVAESPVHELWLMRLGRARDSLESVGRVMARDACDSACLAPFLRNPGSASAALAVDAPAGMTIDEAPGRRGLPGGRSLPALDGRLLFAATSYSLTLFFSRREGPDFVRAMIATSLGGGDASTVFARARSFTPAIDDIDRQWRVWLATFAYGPGRQPPI